MPRFFGLVFAAGLLLAPASRAHAQVSVSVSVGYPAYYGYYGAPAYVNPGAYGGYYGGPGVNINVPGFSFSSGSYPPVFAAPMATSYTTGSYAPYYGVRSGAPSPYSSGYYGTLPGIGVRVGF